MELDALVKQLDAYCEIGGAEAWDNVGMLVQPLGLERVTRVLLCIDCTEPVVREAVRRGAQLIVAYHPVIFSGMKRITPAAGTKQRVVCAALGAGVAVYSPHSALDVKRGGVSDWLARALATPAALAAGTARIVRPSDTAGDLSGALRVVEVADGAPALAPETVAARLRAATGGHVRGALALADPARPVRRLALCVGSGGDALGAVRDADAYVTGEMSHHTVLAHVEAGRHVFLSEHTATERGFLADVLRPDLAALLPGVTVDIASDESEILRIL